MKNHGTGVCASCGQPLDGNRGIEQLLAKLGISDDMIANLRTSMENIDIDEYLDTARHYRVFPGEGVHSEELMRFVRTVDDMGYRGDYSFEVFNDDFRQMPLAVVAKRARQSVKWITDQVSRRSLPARRSMK